MASRSESDDIGRVNVTVGRPFHGILSHGRPTSMLRGDETYETWGYLDFTYSASEMVVAVEWGLYGDEPIEVGYVCSGPRPAGPTDGTRGAGGIWECSLP